MKKQIIKGIIAIVVVVVLILSVMLVILGSDEDNGNGDNEGTIDNRFLGEWKDQDTEFYWIFKSNGSYSVRYLIPPNNYVTEYLGTWGVNGDQLCLHYHDGFCTRFELSNDDKTLTTYSTVNNPPIIWIKQ